MKNKQISFCLAGGILLTGAVLALSAEAFKLPPETVKLKPGRGAPLANGQCLACHSADYITTQPPLSRAAWTATVVKMKEKYGATFPTNHIPALVEYLTQNYGVPASQ